MQCVDRASRGRVPAQSVRDKAAGKALEGLNRDIAGYLVAMGIDRSLFDLVKTVKFEQMHTLKRDELVRFGIDKRDLVESSWRFADHGTRSYVDKVMHERIGAKEFGYCAGGSCAVLHRTSFSTTCAATPRTLSQVPC